MEHYNYWAEDSSEALEHHGIKGQKWGVRRYQNEDGTLTDVGRRRYLNDFNYSKTHDINLGKGATMYRVATNDSADEGKRLYTAISDSDAKRYKGMYSRYFKKKNVQDIYHKTYEVSENTKIASEKSCRDVMKNAIKNDESFRNAAKQVVDEGLKTGNLKGSQKDFNNVLTELNKGQLSDRGFNFLNTSIVLPDTYGFQKTYFNKLSEQGYDGIIDINDKYQTSYRANNPTIIFNTGKIKMTSVNKLDSKEIESLYHQEASRLYTEQLKEENTPTTTAILAAVSGFASGGIVGGVIGGVAGGVAASKTLHDKYHPSY